LVAFARRRGEEWLIALATRLPLRMLDGTDIPRVDPRRWADTGIKLPEEARPLAFRDALFGETLPSGERIAIAAALARYPTALLYAGPG
jgi:(1->4)-alpha-D-glucan 1-alpha-D-glucosylmutase